MYINIPADVAEKLDIVINENLVVEIKGSSIVYSKPGYTKSSESIASIIGKGYSEPLSSMFGKCNDLEHISNDESDEEEY